MATTAAGDKIPVGLGGKRAEQDGALPAAGADAGLHEEILSRIDGWAKKIALLRLEAPAMFFIEAHLPAAALVHHLGLALQPLVTPFFGAERIAPLLELLRDRRNLELLMERIDYHCAARDAAADKKGGS